VAQNLLLFNLMTGAEKGKEEEKVRKRKKKKEEDRRKTEKKENKAYDDVRDSVNKQQGKKSSFLLVAGGCGKKERHFVCNTIAGRAVRARATRGKKKNSFLCAAFFWTYCWLPFGGRLVPANLHIPPFKLPLGTYV